MMQRLTILGFCIVSTLPWLTTRAFAEACPNDAELIRVIPFTYVDTAKPVDMYAVSILIEDGKGYVDSVTSPAVNFTLEGSSTTQALVCHHKVAEGVTEGVTLKLDHITGCALPAAAKVSDAKYTLSFTVTDQDGNSCEYQKFFDHALDNTYGPKDFPHACAPKEESSTSLYAFCMAFKLLEDYTFLPIIEALTGPADTDTISLLVDNCPLVTNQDQLDTDGDTVGDVCDYCPTIKDHDQKDTDKDGQGDACDDDIDGDGLLNAVDNCPTVINGAPFNTDIDGDGTGDACDFDMDGDGLSNDADKCPYVAVSLDDDDGKHNDTNGNGIGNDCEGDTDGDGILDDEDNCKYIKNADQEDYDDDGAGNACDTTPGTKGGGSHGSGAGGGTSCDAERQMPNGNCCNEDSLFSKEANSCVKVPGGGKGGGTGGVCDVFASSVACSSNTGGSGGSSSDGGSDGDTTDGGTTGAEEDSPGCSLLITPSTMPTMITPAKRRGSMLLFLIGLGAFVLFRLRRLV